MAEKDPVVTGVGGLLDGGEGRDRAIRMLPGKI